MIELGEIRYTEAKRGMWERLKIACDFIVESIIAVAIISAIAGVAFALNSIVQFIEHSSMHGMIKLVAVIALTGVEYILLVMDLVGAMYFFVKSFLLLIKRIRDLEE